MTRQRQIITQLLVFFGGFKEAWAKHCLNVAILSKKIASNIDGLNANFAFLYGLVHDIGRSTPRSHKDPRYHCVDGFMILNMLEKRSKKESLSISYLFSKLKWSPLTHSFPDITNLSLVPGYYTPLWDPDVKDKDNMKISGVWDVFMPKMLKGYKPDTYDTIVCLADLMSASNKTVTIEKRLELVSERYGESPKAQEIREAIKRNVEIIENMSHKKLYEIVGLEKGENLA